MARRTYEIEDSDLDEVIRALAEGTEVYAAVGQSIKARQLRAIAVDLEQQQHTHLVVGDL
jgi:exonuclease VII small subunit